MKLYTFVAWFTRIYFVIFILGVIFVWKHPIASTGFVVKEYWHWRHPDPIAVMHWKVSIHEDLIADEKMMAYELAVHRILDATDPYINVYVKPGEFQLSAWRDIYKSRGFEKEEGKTCEVSGFACERWRKSYSENAEPKEEIKVLIAPTKTIVGFSGSPQNEKYLEEMLKGMKFEEKKPVA